MSNIQYYVLKRDRTPNIVIVVCLIGILVGCFLEVVNIVRMNQRLSRDMKIQNVRKCIKKPKYWVYPMSTDNRNDTLQHLHLVLQTIGYEKTTNQTPWDLVWVYISIHKFKKEVPIYLPHQRVSHFPGLDAMTRKVSLATSNSKYIPKAFELPRNKQLFLKYAKENKNTLFLEKGILQRGISLKNLSTIDDTSGLKFAQEFVPNPFLIDGHKFDIGVYVVITSANPLRVYWYKGDVGFRYCPKKYHPLDPMVLDKYVVRGNYMPTWELPTLAQSFSSLGHGMKESFDMYIKSKGKDPSVIWEDVQKALVDILLIKQHHFIQALKYYNGTQDNFFEMIRFDLIIDENFKVYLLEANMSPNLSSVYIRANGVLFEQILFSLFSLTGISQPKSKVSSNNQISVFGEQCLSVCKDNCKAFELCGLCKPCRDNEQEKNLLKAHNEYIHRADFRRLFPPAMSQIDNKEMLTYVVPHNNLSPVDKLQYIWYQAKCNQDITWCT